MKAKSKSKSHSISPEQMKEELKRIYSFKNGKKWLKMIASKYGFHIEHYLDISITDWIAITHKECGRTRRQHEKFVSNKFHFRVMPKSKGHTSPYTGFTKVVSIPMGGQNKRH